ncbi:MAG: hypothetical protein ACOH2J_07640 [Allorhizobium sp.]
MDSIDENPKQNERVNALVIELVSMLSHTELLYVVEKIRAELLGEASALDAQSSSRLGMSRERVKEIRKQLRPSTTRS